MNVSWIPFFIYGLFLVLAALIRAVVGPTAADRLVAINVIGTKLTVLIVLYAHATDQGALLDLALIYALISYVGSVIFAKVLGADGLVD